MDPLILAVQVIKAVAELILAGVLLRKWRSHSPRFFTDLPFMYGAVFAVLGLGESVDVLIEAELIITTVIAHQFRLMFVIAGVAIMCFSLFQIWVPKRKRVKYGGISLYGASWVLFTWMSSTREAIYLLAAGYLMMMIIPYCVTYFLVYRYRRLPDIDARLVLLATIFLVVGQGFKTLFLTFGILWISETIDLIAWILIAAGVTRPAPYIKQLTVQPTPPIIQEQQTPSRL